MFLIGYFTSCRNYNTAKGSYDIFLGVGTRAINHRAINRPYVNQDRHMFRDEFRAMIYIALYVVYVSSITTFFTRVNSMLYCERFMKIATNEYSNSCDHAALRNNISINLSSSAINVTVRIAPFNKALYNRAFANECNSMTFK